MAWCRRDASPLLMHWNYVSFALSHRYTCTLLCICVRLYGPVAESESCMCYSAKLSLISSSNTQVLTCPLTLLLTVETVQVWVKLCQLASVSLWVNTVRTQPPKQPINYIWHWRLKWNNQFLMFPQTNQPTNQPVHLLLFHCQSVRPPIYPCVPELCSQLSPLAPGQYNEL